MTEEAEMYSDEVIKAQFEEARALAIHMSTMMIGVDVRIAAAALILLTEAMVNSAPSAEYLKMLMRTFLKLLWDIVKRLENEAGETVH